MTHRYGTNPAAQLAVIEQMLAHGRGGDQSEASDGPGELVVASADDAWFDDRAERIEERAMWGGAA